MFALITDCNQIKQDNVVDIHDLVDRYGIYVSQMTTNMLRLSKSQSVVFSFMTCHGFVTRVTWQMPHVEQKLLTLTEHPGFKRGSCCSIFIILCNGLQIIICPSVLLLLVFVLSVFRFTAYDYHFDIFKLLAYLE